MNANNQQSTYRETPPKPASPIDSQMASWQMQLSVLENVVAQIELSLANILEGEPGKLVSIHAGTSAPDVPPSCPMEESMRHRNAALQMQIARLNSLRDRIRL